MQTYDDETAIEIPDPICYQKWKLEVVCEKKRLRKGANFRILSLLLSVTAAEIQVSAQAISWFRRVASKSIKSWCTNLNLCSAVSL